MLIWRRRLAILEFKMFDYGVQVLASGARTGGWSWSGCSCAHGIDGCPHINQLSDFRRRGA